MSQSKVAAFTLFTALCIGLAGQAHAESKYFEASQRHFEDLASKAATLSRDVDTPGEKNVCNYFTATAMTYAVRAHALAQLADVADKVHGGEDKALVQRKMAETQAFTTRYIEGDLRLLENLAATSRNSRIRDLGLRLVNELRVFEHNADTVRSQ